VEQHEKDLLEEKTKATRHAQALEVLFVSLTSRSNFGLGAGGKMQETR